MSTIYTIYLAKNTINQKCYIGFDSAWPARQLRHKHSHVRGNSKFYNAIRKYGWDNFEWSVLYQSTDGDHCLNVMEKYFIREYNSFMNGYNMTEGGEGVVGYKHSSEQLLKISNAAKKPKSESWKSSRSKCRGEKHHNFNKPVSKEQKLKISKSLKGVIPWNKGLKGLQESPNRTPVTINGVSYQSKLEAMIALDTSLYKLNKLINSSGE